jgi:hypothetical protein
MLTIRRPKSGRTLVALALGVLLTVVLGVSSPTRVLAEPVVPRPVRSGNVDKATPKPSARPAAHTTNKKSTARKTTARPTHRKPKARQAFRKPSPARLKFIKSIPRRVSSGFDPRFHGFSFANWSSDTAATAISIDTLVRLFGTSSICEAVENGSCVPFAKASALVDRLNMLLATGRCEGMVALADELFRHPEMISSISAETTHISGLSPEAASSEIAFWWATQITPQANKAAKATRKMTPTRIVKTIARRIKLGTGGTLGMYYKGMGHAVLPIAVARKGYIAKVSVYDSNTPNTVQYLYVNLRTNKWKYRAIAEDGTVLINWRGRNAGGLDLVAPVARKSQIVTSFSIAIP